MKKFILILLLFIAPSLAYCDPMAEAALLTQTSSYNPVYLNAILAEPSAAHLWLFVNPSGTIKDYIGTDNPSIPSGLTMGQTGLLVNQTNKAALTDGTAVISLTQGTTGKYTYNSNCTFEFIVNLNCPRAGTQTQYALFSKPGTVLYYGFTLKLQYNDIGVNGIGLTNGMCPEVYIQDNTGTGVYKMAALTDLTNGASYLIDFVYSYTNSTPLMLVYVNGNLIEGFEVFNSFALGDFASSSVGVIGNFNTAPSAGLTNSVIQACAMFNTNLTYGQILNHYLASQGQPYSPTINNYSQLRDITPNPLMALQCLAPFHTPAGWYVFGGLKTNDYIIPTGPVAGAWDSPITKVAVLFSPSLLPGTFTPAGSAGIAFDASAFPNIASLGRPCVISNSATGSNVMFGHYSSNLYASGYSTVMASKTIDGPYTLISQGILLNGNQVADQSLCCVGTNGWSIYAVLGNTSLNITQLDTNFYASAGSATVVSTSAGSGMHLESPQLFWNGTNWVTITCPEEFYTARLCTNVFYSVCSTWNGTWPAMQSLFKVGENPALTGNAFQSCSVVSNIDGLGNWGLMGDYWSNTNQARSSTVIGKIVFDTATTLHVTPSKAVRFQ